MRLLYAEDEPEMSEAVADILRFHKYTVDVAADGDEALALAEDGVYDGIILDVMMDGKNGFEVLSALRRSGVRTPVLMLTARSEVEDRIEGLDLGADDYLPKPFAMGALLARVRAMLRRRDEYRPEVLSFGDIVLNPADATISCGTDSTALANLEYRLCETLIENRGIYLSAETLLTKVWGYDTDADVNTVWVYMSGLRKRLKSIGSRVTIQSKRNIGYMLAEKE